MFPPDTRVAVLTGDMQTDNDAKRLAKYGFPVRQITTGGSCHLDARMVERELEGWDLEALDYLFIENVGNLVCPSSYDLGEHDKIVLLSVTEGEDNPLKYPGTFSRAGLVILNKIDLLPYVQFDTGKAKENVRKVNPGAEILEVSATTGANLDQWYAWLEKKRSGCVRALSALVES
jgi:hydrogenase nickel incorporation protein HypB